MNMNTYALMREVLSAPPHHFLTLNGAAEKRIHEKNQELSSYRRELERVRQALQNQKRHHAVGSGELVRELREQVASLRQREEDLLTKSRQMEEGLVNLVILQSQLKKAQEEGNRQKASALSAEKKMQEATKEQERQRQHYNAVGRRTAKELERLRHADASTASGEQADLIREAQEELERQKRRYNELIKLCEANKKRMGEMERNLNQKTREGETLTETLEKTLGELNAKNRVINDLQKINPEQGKPIHEELQQVKRLREANEGEMKKMREDMKSAIQSKQAIGEELEKARKKIELLVLSIQPSPTTNFVEQMEKDLQRVKSEKNAQNKKYNELQRIRDELESKIKIMQTDLDNALSEKRRNETFLEAAQNELKTRNEKIEELTGKIGTLEKAFEQNSANSNTSKRLLESLLKETATQLQNEKEKTKLLTSRISELEQKLKKSEARANLAEKSLKIHLNKMEKMERVQQGQASRPHSGVRKDHYHVNNIYAKWAQVSNNWMYILKKEIRNNPNNFLDEIKRIVRDVSEKCITDLKSLRNDLEGKNQNHCDTRIAEVQRKSDDVVKMWRDGYETYLNELNDFEKIIGKASPDELKKLYCEFSYSENEKHMKHWKNIKNGNPLDREQHSVHFACLTTAFDKAESTWMQKIRNQTPENKERQVKFQDKYKTLQNEYARLPDRSISATQREIYTFKIKYFIQMVELHGSNTEYENADFISEFLLQQINSKTLHTSRYVHYDRFRTEFRDTLEPSWMFLNTLPGRENEYDRKAEVSRIKSNINRYFFAMMEQLPGDHLEIERWRSELILQTEKLQYDFRKEPENREKQEGQQGPRVHIANQESTNKRSGWRWFFSRSSQEKHNEQGQARRSPGKPAAQREESESEEEKKIVERLKQYLIETKSKELDEDIAFLETAYKGNENVIKYLTELKKLWNKSSPWEFIGVQRTASYDEIKRATRALKFKYHSDKVKPVGHENNTQFSNQNYHKRPSVRLNKTASTTFIALGEIFGGLTAIAKSQS